MFYKSCKNCGKQYKSVYKYRQLFCTKKCKSLSYALPKPLTISASTPASTGAASELIVCADLLHRGFEVFRAVSPSCSADIIAQKNDQLYRIEIKTARISHKGKITYAKPVNTTKYDVLALVFPDNKNEIMYIPSNFDVM